MILKLKAMRLLALFTLFTVCACLVVDSAYAWTKEEETRLWKLLGSTAYVSEGRKGGAIIYVVAYPTCGWSKRFYDDSRQSVENVEIRWIFYPINDQRAKDMVGYLAAKNSADDLSAAFSGRLRAPPLSSSRANLQAAKKNADIVGGSLREFTGRRTVSPTLFFFKNGKLYMHQGYPEPKVTKDILSDGADSKVKAKSEIVVEADAREEVLSTTPQEAENNVQHEPEEGEAEESTPSRENTEEPKHHFEEAPSAHTPSSPRDLEF